MDKVTTEREALADLIQAQGLYVPSLHSCINPWWAADRILAAGFRRQGPVTDGEAEAVARVMWQSDDAEMDTSWLSNRDFYLTTARAALEAAREART